MIMRQGHFYLFLIPILSLVYFGLTSCSPKIDRKALVTRHNVIITKPDKMAPLSVGRCAPAGMVVRRDPIRAFPMMGRGM